MIKARGRPARAETGGAWYVVPQRAGGTRLRPGAVLLPVGTIDEDTAAAVIPEKDAVVLVYCRSGNRSRTAASRLAGLGYANVYEFGGISTWPYDIEP